MSALKAQWVVTAGVLMGEPEDKYTRVWEYTSEDDEKDRASEWPTITRFSTQMEAANLYARTIMVPQAINWVKLEFIWL